MPALALTYRPFMVGGFADPDALSALRMPGPAAQIVIAGWAEAGTGTGTASGTPGDPPTFLLAVTGWDGLVPLWTGLGPEQGPGGPGADLVALDADRVVALLPGQVMLGIDLTTGICVPSAPATRLPDRIFPLKKGGMALFRAPDGTTTIAALRQRRGTTGVQIGVPWPGPVLTQGQSPSQILRDAARRLVMTADDPVRGFQLWREDAPGQWTHLIGDGASRHGCNAVVRDATLWQGHLALAVGSTPAIRARLHGLQIPGEIVLLAPDGAVGLLSGEVRTSMGPTTGHSVTRLMVPQLPAAAVMALRAGDVARLGTVADCLIVALDRNGKDGDGLMSIHAITPGFALTALGICAGPVHALPAIGKTVGVVLAVED